jgi:hypothetical protein
MSSRAGQVTLGLAAAAAVVLLSASVALPAASKQPVAMEASGSGPLGGSFRITPGGVGALKPDTGTYTFRASKKEVVRGGQRVTLYVVTATFKGKLGTLVTKERIEDVAAGRSYRVGTGTWSTAPARGTGQYAGLSAAGGSAYVLTPTRGPFARYEGFVTS